MGFGLDALVTSVGIVAFFVLSVKILIINPSKQNRTGQRKSDQKNTIIYRLILIWIIVNAEFQKAADYQDIRYYKSEDDRFGIVKRPGWYIYGWGYQVLQRRLSRLSIARGVHRSYLSQQQANPVFISYSLQSIFAKGIRPLLVQ